MDKAVLFSELIGLTIKELVKQDEGLDIHTTCGRTFRLAHSQECCESVFIESIVGDLSDLIGSPILLAEEIKNEENAIPPPPSDNWVYKYQSELTLWTFYKLATIKGYVDVRFFGESSGYYSVGVDFIEILGGVK